MRFVIDETSWRFDLLDPDTCVDVFEAMLDQLDSAQEQGNDACYSEDLFHTKILGNKCFYDLYAKDSPIQIPREVRERVSSVFSRLAKWQELSADWPASFDVEINGSSKEEAPSIAWAHKQSSDNIANSIACLILHGGRQSGFLNVAIDGTEVRLWFVEDGHGYIEFFRWLIIKTTNNFKQMAVLASSAFPSIDFVPNAFRGISSMSKPYNELIEGLVFHLGVLSDHGERIFSGPRDRAASEFGSFGVTVSNENGRTRANHIARNERTIIIDGSDIIFWWHSKLEPDRDRIHFYPDRIRNGGRLLVGIFCRHLTT
jgi:hypothetical protein